MSWHVPDGPAPVAAEAEPGPPAVDAATLYRQAVLEVVASLLLAEGRLLGRRVALAWPDGPPHEWSPDALAALGRKWKRDGRGGLNRWAETAKVAADADRDEALMEALADSTWFFLKRGKDGEPDRLEPR